jgi:hypothetical protein
MFRASLGSWQGNAGRARSVAMGVRHNLEAFGSVRPELANLYDRRYAVYRDLYTATRPLLPRL